MDISVNSPATVKQYNNSVYDLGDCVFYPSYGELHSKISEQHLHIEPRVSQVFECLAKARGEIVTRTEIFDTVWPNMIVSDDSLNRCISVLRKQLKAFNHSIGIITHPKIGFHLEYKKGRSPTPENNDANITIERSAESEANNTRQKQNELLTAPANKPQPFLVIPFIALLLSLLTVVGIITLISYRLAAAANTQVNVTSTLNDMRVVILPFGAPSTLQSQYGQITERLRSLIAQHPKHSTIATTELLGSQEKSPIKLGKTYNARHLVTGTIYSENQRDLLSLEIIDSHTGDLLANKVLNLRLFDNSVNAQIITTHIIATIGENLYQTKPNEQINYIISSANYLFSPNTNWQSRRPVIALIAKTIIDIKPNSVVALKTLASFLSSTFWPHTYQQTPFINLSASILKRAIKLAQHDVDLYRQLAQVQTMQYKWHDAQATIAQGQQELTKSGIIDEQNVYALRVYTHQISPDVISYYQTQHQQLPFNEHISLTLTSLLVLTNQTEQAISLLTNAVIDDTSWQIWGIIFGSYLIHHQEINRGKELLTYGLSFLGLTELQQTHVMEFMINNSNKSHSTITFKPSEINEIPDVAKLYLYSALGLSDEYYQLAYQLAEVKQFQLNSLVSFYSEKLRQDPRFIPLMKKIKLLPYWRTNGLPLYCQNQTPIKCL